MSNVQANNAEQEALAQYFDAIAALPAHLSCKDLSTDPLLKKAPRENIDDHSCPVVGGIPLLSKIGQGSFSAIYFAIHPMLGRRVAIRVLPLPVNPKADRFQRFMAEVKAASEIKSPNIVETIDFGIESGTFYQTMEYVAGKSAQDYLDILKIKLKPGLDEMTLLDMCIAVATGLAESHKRGFLHRDIKPTSLLIPATTGESLNFNATKLNDMGLAFNENTACLLAGSQAESGTPGLMSPEQASGVDLTRASDVFLFGATMYSLLIGQPPFGGLSLNSVLSATLIQDVDDIRTWRPDISRATAKILEIALQKQPTRRFPDAAVMLSALRLSKNSVSGNLDTQLIAMRAIENLVPPSTHETTFVPKIIPSPAESEPTLIGQTRAILHAPSHAESAKADSPFGEDIPPPNSPTNGNGTGIRQRTPEEDAALVKASIARLRAIGDDGINKKAIAVEEEWEDPTKTAVNEPEAVSAATGGGGVKGAMLVVLLLLAAGGIGAWKMGWLVGEKKPSTTIARTDPKPDPSQPQPPPVTPDPAQAARIAEEKERLAREAEAKLRREKEEAEALALKEKAAAEAAEKARREKEIADKLEKERLAKEAADREQKEKERVAAQERARMEKEAAEQERLKRERVAAEQERLRLEKEKAAAAALAAEAARNSKPEISLDLGGIPMTVLRVAGGKFNMGTNPADLNAMATSLGVDAADYQNEIPAHRAVCGNFYIAKTPVTVAQFSRFVQETGFRTAAEKSGAAYTLENGSWHRTAGACWSKPGFAQTDASPVVFLNSNDCEAFAAWASKKTGKPLRLPTESEWEYAARGSDGNVWPWGNQWDGLRANHADVRLRPEVPPSWDLSVVDDGFAFTSPTGSYDNKSWCGALDLAGNVFQWTQSDYEAYPKNPQAPRIIVEPSDNVSRDSKRILKGGSFLSRPADCRSAARRAVSPRAFSCEFGLRLVYSAN